MAHVARFGHGTDFENLRGGGDGRRGERAVKIWRAFDKAGLSLRLRNGGCSIHLTDGFCARNSNAVCFHPVKVDKTQLATMKTTKTRKQPAEKASTSSRKSKEAKPEVSETTIEAKIDVGFGNNLYLRGQGAGLSWERGTPLTCVDGQTWRWSAPVSDELTFKFLLNDAIWAKGENLVVKPGQRLEISPDF